MHVEKGLSLEYFQDIFLNVIFSCTLCYPTHDNGLLVVMKGKHCGKYVQRIHHRYEQETVIIILGVIKRIENTADSLTGEQLELSADHLCVAVKTKEDKKHNESIMTALRKQARKIHAK